MCDTPPNVRHAPYLMCDTEQGGETRMWEGRHGRRHGAVRGDRAGRGDMEGDTEQGVETRSWEGRQGAIRLRLYPKTPMCLP
ncbi:hypothetical protein FKM82_017262 [Ascaphus truei]